MVKTNRIQIQFHHQKKKLVLFVHVEEVKKGRFSVMGDERSGSMTSVSSQEKAISEGSGGSNTAVGTNPTASVPNPTATGLTGTNPTQTQQPERTIERERTITTEEQGGTRTIN
jgi:hypothetical protein